MKIQKNEVWKIRSRGFDGVIKVLETIKDTKEDDFFKAEIVEGIKSYLSLNRYQEKKGDKLSFRTTLTEFTEKQE